MADTVAEKRRAAAQKAAATRARNREVGLLQSRIDNAKASLSIGKPTPADIDRTNTLVRSLEMQVSKIKSGAGPKAKSGRVAGMTADSPFPSAMTKGARTGTAASKGGLNLPSAASDIAFEVSRRTFEKKFGVGGDVSNGLTKRQMDDAVMSRRRPNEVLAELSRGPSSPRDRTLKPSADAAMARKIDTVDAIAKGLDRLSKDLAKPTAVAEAAATPKAPPPPVRSGLSTATKVGIGIGVAAAAAAAYGAINSAKSAPASASATPPPHQPPTALDTVSAGAGAATAAAFGTSLAGAAASRGTSSVARAISAAGRVATKALLPLAAVAGVADAAATANREGAKEGAIKAGLNLAPLAAFAAGPVVGAAVTVGAVAIDMMRSSRKAKAESAQAQPPAVDPRRHDHTPLRAMEDARQGPRERAANEMLLNATHAVGSVQYRRALMRQAAAGDPVSKAIVSAGPRPNMPQVIAEHPNRATANFYDQTTLLSETSSPLGARAADKVQTMYGPAFRAAGDVMARRAEVRAAQTETARAAATRASGDMKRTNTMGGSARSAAAPQRTDGETDSYTRMVNGKAVQVKAYKTPDRRR